MHSFIVQHFETPNSQDTYKIVPETSIGITEVREAIKFLSKKPTQSPNNIVVFYNAHLLTIPAQNAILKILEEPPANSLIYLVTTQPDQLIPTILSRCQIIYSPNLPNLPNLPNSANLLTKLQSAPIGERLKILEEQEFDRISAFKFLDDLEFIIHKDLSFSKIYPAVFQTRKYLKANCNLKLSMDYFAINLGVVLRPNGC